jgi:hypothetical protein
MSLNKGASILHEPTLVEVLKHEELENMPDLAGTNPDHDARYAQLIHVLRHQAGGADALTALLRSIITDFWGAPFWASIPDKPSTFPPNVHKASHQDGGGDEISLGGLSGDPADTINKSLLTARGQIIIRNASAPAALAPGTSGQFLKTLGAGADPAWAAVDYPRKLKPNFTRWAVPGWYIGYQGLMGVIVTAGSIYYTPIFVSEKTTYIRIGIYVLTKGAAGTTADLRIFQWADGVPGALLLSCGTVSTATTGAKEITISQELDRGYYFLAIRCTGTPELMSPPTTIGSSVPIAPPVQGVADGNYGAAELVILAVDAAYADPAPAPTYGKGAHYCFVLLREN